MEIVRLPKVSESAPEKLAPAGEGRPPEPPDGGDDDGREPKLPEANATKYDQSAAMSNAEILLWQSRLRIDLGLLVGALAIGAMVAGVATDAAYVVLAAVAAYVGTVAATAALVRRRRRARQWVVVLTIVADICFIFGTTMVVVPPQYYDRTLLLAFIILHLTEFYFGFAFAWGTLMAIVAFHSAMVGLAIARGENLSLPQELWSLSIFVAAAGAFIVHSGGLKRRLSHMSVLLERAASGDFGEEYDVREDVHPDAVTMVGRSLNRVRAQLATMVLSDPLSGCLNRRGLEQQLGRELNRAVRSRGDISLIVIDVDFFKRINDTFGHLAGDQVIRELGEVLRDVARGGDVVARLGGDEFAILLPNTGAAGAYRLATRLHESVTHRPFTGVGGRVPVTVSVGVVSDLVTDVNIGQDLLSRADEALYAAKDAGRNRVSIWTPNLRIMALARAREQVAGH